MSCAEVSLIFSVVSPTLAGFARLRDRLCFLDAATRQNVVNGLVVNEIKRFRAVLTVLSGVLPGAIAASPLFEAHEVIDVRLSGPVTSLLKDRESREELPFVLTANGVDHEIEVRLRGHSRRRVCEFPPIRLDFRRRETAGTIFEGQDKLKVVTHCRNYDRGEQDMLQEYIVYRIFNAITEDSYRVRLLRMEYVDTQGKLDSKARYRYAFVIEPADEVAARIGSTRGELTGFPVHRHDKSVAARVYVFQYLVGNTDYSFVKADYDDFCCHNGDLFERDGKVLYLPYDFDLTGVVNARYAYPDPLLPIDNVTSRLYRGLCTDRSLLTAAIRRVAAREAEILAIVDEVSGLSKDNVETTRRYLKRFFEQARDQNAMLRNFERRCQDPLS